MRSPKLQEQPQWYLASVGGMAFAHRREVPLLSERNHRARSSVVSTRKHHPKQMLCLSAGIILQRTANRGRDPRENRNRQFGDFGTHQQGGHGGCIVLHAPTVQFSIVMVLILPSCPVIHTARRLLYGAGGGRGAYAAVAAREPLLSACNAG